MKISTDPINTLENGIAKNKTKIISIYLVLLLTILIFLSLFSVRKIDISSQSRGIVRSTTDNVPLSSLVNGKVTFVNLKNNGIVQKGDTLVAITQENLNTEKANNQEAASTIQYQIHDLTQVSQGKAAGLKTIAMHQEWQSYNNKKKELQIKIAQAKIVFDRNKQLFDKGIIAKAEFEKYRFDYTYSQQALSGIEKNQLSL